MDYLFICNLICIFVNGGVYIIIIKKSDGWRLYDSLIECVGDNIIH